MAHPGPWIALAGSVLLLGLGVWLTARRITQAQRGERRFLRHRRRLLRVYHRRRDGRVYDPARNPELAGWG